MPASEQGVNFSRYMLVPRTLIFVTRANNILLLKGADDKLLWPGLYNGIGGHVEQGEDIFTAARREFLEETGLRLSSLWLCGIFTIDTQTNPGVCVYCFRGECIDGKLITSKEGSLEWINLSKLFQLQLVTDLSTLLPKVLTMNNGEPPFISHSSYNEKGDLVIKFI